MNRRQLHAFAVARRQGAGFTAALVRVPGTRVRIAACLPSPLPASAAGPVHLEAVPNGDWSAVAGTLLDILEASRSSLLARYAAGGTIALLGADHVAAAPTPARYPAASPPARWSYEQPARVCAIELRRFLTGAVLASLLATPAEAPPAAG